jgi:CHASE2 domain-containing sensor protein
MHVALYTFALFCGISTARATSIMDRAGVRDRTAVFSIISGLSFLATFATVGLGFLLYSWWTPIVASMAMALLVGVVVTRATHAFFYKAVPITGLVTIAICAYGWLKWAGAG